MAEYKVVDAEQLDSDLVRIATKIKAKGGMSDNLEFPQGFIDGVDSIDTSKEEQEKTVEITENGTTEVLPDDGKVLSKVTVNVEVESGGEDLAALETKIDESGILAKTDPPVETFDEKADRLIAMANVFDKLPTVSFSGATITEIPFYIDKPAANMAYGFHGTTNLVRMVGVNTSRATNCSYMFSNSGIQVIERPFDFSACTALSAFFNANKLVEVRIVAGTIKVNTNISSAVLSDESIQSIIDGLADLTGGTAQTLTLHATVKAKLTEEQLATITSKNWSVA